MSIDALQVAQTYFDAWNRRDAAAILATFAEGGTYSDPTSGGPLTGAAIGAYAQGLWQAFPDLNLEIVSVAANDSGMVCAEWLMKGTNQGPLNGLPPTGKPVELPGADFIRVEGAKIRSVQGYFDSGALPRALGLDVIVQPKAIGPFSFGVSTRASNGSNAMPGAFSITWLEARSEDEKQRVHEDGRQIVTEMLGMPGFISWVGVAVGDRLLTITAWDKPESIAPLMKNGQHRSSIGRFFGPEIARGGSTGVWVPGRLNARWIRCTECSKMADVEKSEGKCGCGASLPAALPYW